MKKSQTISPTFVEHFPAELDEGILYISMKYASATHRCCCGCGSEVITPFSPTDWSLLFDGRSVSLHPSIGNWNFACKSHYWIRNNCVKWAEQWSSKQIGLERKRDRHAKQVYFKNATFDDFDDNANSDSLMQSENEKTVWGKLKKKFSFRF